MTIISELISCGQKFPVINGVHISSKHVAGIMALNLKKDASYFSYILLLL